MSTKRGLSAIGGRILWLRKSTAVTPGPIPVSKGFQNCTHAVLQRKRRGRGELYWQCGNSREKSVSPEQVILPRWGDFGRLMSLMRYLCENGVGLGHWLDVLDDAGRCTGPARLQWAAGERKPARFVAFAGFEGQTWYIILN